MCRRARGRDDAIAMRAATSAQSIPVADRHGRCPEQVTGASGARAHANARDPAEIRASAAVQAAA
jgi:hypothetical protein